MVFFETVFPALFRSLTRSCHAVLERSLTFLMIIDALGGEILHHLELLSFSYNCSNSSYLLTKLFGYFPVAHPSLVQVYYFIPDVLTQLSGLGHCGEVGVCLIECVDRCLLYR
ncbi:hypothetical protein ATANTOWER_002358 [Ataeniobius toweri]|uniref:Secreted protein n=1 Tax=Ataeniobius toweri TaxID=208326 RepID=A0ABU7CE79_9TELE|nr:hypothetical protein [Ataeniobius toweri]